MSAPMPAIVEKLVVTPGNLHNGRTGGGALPDEPGDAHANSAYRGQTSATAVRAKGGSFAHRADRHVGPALATTRCKSSGAGTMACSACAAGP
jgi:hypothetical protein